MPQKKKNKRTFRTLLVATIVTALCCFTPILVIAFGLAGLGAAVGYLDYVLFPLLGVLIILLILSWKKQKNCDDECDSRALYRTK